jgi:hypothetical protein
VGWVGVDFDGTLCRLRDGQPVPSMVERIRVLRSQNVEVRICTARVNPQYSQEHVREHENFVKRWCLEFLGEVLPVVACKDYEMVLLYDDRAVAVETDTGRCRGWLDQVEISVEERRTL